MKLSVAMVLAFLNGPKRVVQWLDGDIEYAAHLSTGEVDATNPEVTWLTYDIYSSAGDVDVIVLRFRAKYSVAFEEDKQLEFNF